MNRLFFKNILLLFFLVTTLTGCVNLKYVSDFSSSSLKSIRNFEEIGYSFTMNCLENCQEEKVNNLSFIALECDCQANKSADSVTLIIYNAVKGYLDGLSNLSNNSLTNYKVNVVAKSLNQQDYKSLNIEKTHVDAWLNISNILFKAFTNKYRRSKIKEYVNAGNEPLKVLTGFLDFNLSENLSGKLNVQKQRLKDYYFDLTNDTTLSTFEKRNAAADYYNRINKIEDKQKELTTYSKILKKVAGGHQKLTDNLQRLNKDEVMEQLIQYSSDIQDLITEYNKIAK